MATFATSSSASGSVNLTASQLGLQSNRAYRVIRVSTDCQATSGNTAQGVIINPTEAAVNDIFSIGQPTVVGSNRVTLTVVNQSRLFISFKGADVVFTLNLVQPNTTLIVFRVWLEVQPDAIVV
jgi:hypothetical protein